MSWRAAFATAVLGGALLAAACAPIPPPGVLSRIDEVRAAPASAEAQRYAPSAFAYAEKLRQDARDALDKDGDFAASQIIGEQALAAYARATALSRVARSEDVRVAAEAALAASEKQLGEIEAEQQQVAADIEALKKRLLVLQSTEPIEPSGEARGAQEQARKQATATLRLQARLLCVAAELLHQATAPGAAAPAELKQASQALSELEQALGAEPAAAPIDQAMRARAGCLGALTLIRRTNTPRTKALGAADALLAELSEAGYDLLRRDDRGVVITLRDVFEKGGQLTAEASRTLAALAATARSHPRFPLLIVLHQHRPIRPAEQASWQQRGELIRRALAPGAAVTGVEIAGTVAPVVDPDSKHSARNERVDIVFVAPEAL